VTRLREGLFLRARTLMRRNPWPDTPPPSSPPTTLFSPSLFHQSKRFFKPTGRIFSNFPPNPAYSRYVCVWLVHSFPPPLLTSIALMISFVLIRELQCAGLFFTACPNLGNAFHKSSSVPLSSFNFHTSPLGPGCEGFSTLSSLIFRGRQFPWQSFLVIGLVQLQPSVFPGHSRPFFFFTL